MRKGYREMACKFCGKNNMKEIIDLGHQPLANAFLTKEQLSLPEIHYPLRVDVCEDCKLVQLREMVDPKTIFKNDYIYYSSQSPANVKHAEELVGSLQLQKGMTVVEIASNDGYLLQHIPEGVERLGIEPCKDVAEVAIEMGIPTVIDFFTETLAKDLNIEADVIIGINVFAHVPDINNFVSGLEKLLKPDGMIIIEFPHFYNLIKQNQFDTIYHEHAFYFSLEACLNIFKAHGLKVFAVKEIPEHGGSLRLFIGRGNKTVSSSVYTMYAMEALSGMELSAFISQVFTIRQRTLEKLFEIKHKKREFYTDIVGYGAAAKANTFLNFCGINTDLIPFIIDRSTYKQDMFLPGSHIPVEGEESLKITRPKYVMIFPWNLQEEIVNQLSYIRNWKGKFITAIPEIDIW